MPIPKLVRTDVASSNRSSTVNTPYKPPYKKQKASLSLADGSGEQKSEKLLRLTLLVPKLFE